MTRRKLSPADLRHVAHQPRSTPTPAGDGMRGTWSILPPAHHSFLNSEDPAWRVHIACNQGTPPNEWIESPTHPGRWEPANDSRWWLAFEPCGPDCVCRQ